MREPMTADWLAVGEEVQVAGAEGRPVVALESSLSRLYAGIHYRFDMEAGLAIGRGAAALALSADLSQVAPLP